jgi:hypothetical protein
VAPSAAPASPGTAIAAVVQLTVVPQLSGVAVSPSCVWLLVLPLFFVVGAVYPVEPVLPPPPQLELGADLRVSVQSF